MDKESALLVVAKDLFIESLKFRKVDDKLKDKRGVSADDFVEEFGMFLKRLKSVTEH